MYHDDPLWGPIALDEPVVAALVRSGPVQRLRGIAQAGASAYLYPERASITRFDHSLGVMHVLAALRATLEEQVAGLLHDVPHTAFSHTVDIAFPSAEYNFHEEFHRRIVLDSELPQILTSHAIPVETVIEPERFPLLEQPLPLICADRVDYTLRDRHASGRLSSREAQAYLARLIPTPEGILHPDVDSALWFARHFVEANHTSWTGPDEAGAYWALGNAVKRAVSLGILRLQQLFLTDQEVMERLRSSADPEISGYLQLLEPGTRFFAVTTDGPYFDTHMKQRVVDPLVLQSGTSVPQPLSHFSPSYARLLAGIPPLGTLTYRLWSDKMPAILAQIYGDMSLRRGAR